MMAGKETVRDREVTKPSWRETAVAKIVAGSETTPEPRPSPPFIGRLDGALKFPLLSDEAKRDDLTPEEINPGQSNGQLNGHGIRWGSLYRQSLLFLAIEHGFRLAMQPDSREAIKGPFFKDYFKSVRGLRGWGDGDPFLTNYIGHGMMGAVTGFMWLNNDPKSRQSDVEFNREYLKRRLRAMTFSAVYSAQFELGPISEASLGNVGIKPGKKSPHPMSYTDIVVTPTVGTLWLIGEDALERYIVRPIENRTSNRFVRLMVRSWLNPSRSFANLLRGKWFWYRDGRGL